MRTFRALLLAAALSAGLLAVPAPARAGTPTVWGGWVRQQPGETLTAALANRQSELDATFGAHRVYFRADPGPWDQGRLALPLPVHVSFKLLPADVLAGRKDGVLRTWFSSAPSDRPVDWTLWHEPEDDIEAGSFTAAQFRAAWQRVAAIAESYGPSNLVPTVVLMDWTVAVDTQGRSMTGRDWRDYWPTIPGLRLAWDVYGFDDVDPPLVDNQSMAEHQLSRPSLAVSRELGLPYLVAELGYADVRDRPVWLAETGEWLRDRNAGQVLYWDAVGPRADYRLLDTASQQAWGQVMSGRQFTGDPEVGVPQVVDTDPLTWATWVDPRGSVWTVRCVSWRTDGTGYFEGRPRLVWGNPETFTCGRNVSAGSWVVRVKGYDQDGTLRWRSEKVTVKV